MQAYKTILFYYFFKDFIYSFLEREEEKEKERERNINVWLPLMRPILRTWPATQACALTGNRTGDTLVHSPHSIHWATPARAIFLNWFLKKKKLYPEKWNYFPIVTQKTRNSFLNLNVHKKFRKIFSKPEFLKPWFSLLLNNFKGVKDLRHLKISQFHYFYIQNIY